MVRKGPCDFRQESLDDFWMFPESGCIRRGRDWDGWALRVFCPVAVVLGVSAMSVAGRVRLQATGHATMEKA